MAISWEPVPEESNDKISHRISKVTKKTAEEISGVILNWECLKALFRRLVKNTGVVLGAGWELETTPLKECGKIS